MQIQEFLEIKRGEGPPPLPAKVKPGSKLFSKSLIEMKDMDAITKDLENASQTALDYKIRCIAESKKALDKAIKEATDKYEKAVANYESFYNQRIEKATKIFTDRKNTIEQRSATPPSSNIAPIESQTLEPPIESQKSREGPPSLPSISSEDLQTLEEVIDNNLRADYYYTQQQLMREGAIPKDYYFLMTERAEQRRREKEQSLKKPPKVVQKHIGGGDPPPSLPPCQISNSNEDLVIPSL